MGKKSPRTLTEWKQKLAYGAGFHAVSQLGNDLYEYDAAGELTMRIPVDAKTKKLRAKKATAIKNARWPLLKNPEDLARTQKTKLSEIQRDHRGLYRAYLLQGAAPRGLIRAYREPGHGGCKGNASAEEAVCERGRSSRRTSAGYAPGGDEL